MRRKVHASGPPPILDPAPAAPAPQAALPPPPAPPEDDWTVEALDRLDSVIDKIRSNSTDRLARIARLVVVGLLIAIMGVATAVLATIALVRALNEVIPGQVWIVYMLLGAIFTAVGVFLWSSKTPKPEH